MIRDYLTEIFRIYEELAEGEFNSQKEDICACTFRPMQGPLAVRSIPFF
jgi:hypothetical protein